VSIDPETIKRAREIIAAASKPPYVVGTLRGDEHAAHVAIFTEMLALAPDRLKCWTVVIPDGEKPIEEFSLSVAITGNGPTSEANALYIKHSHDPVGGWAACLDEIDRLRAENLRLRESLDVWSGRSPSGRHA